MKKILFHLNQLFLKYRPLLEFISLISNIATIAFTIWVYFTQHSLEETRSLANLNNSAHNTVESFMDSVSQLNIKDTNKEENIEKVHDFAIENYNKILIQISNNEVLKEEQKNLLKDCLFNEKSIANPQTGLKNVNDIFQSYGGNSSKLEKELFFNYISYIQAITKSNLSKMDEAKKRNQNYCVTYLFIK